MENNEERDLNSAEQIEQTDEGTAAEAAFAEVESVDSSELPALIECLLVVNGSPLSLEKLAHITGFTVDEVNAAVVSLKERLISSGSGLELSEVCEGVQIRTAVKFGAHISALKLDRPRRLSAAALETLAIVAYRQPIVKSDIEAIRGVDATPTLKTLLDRRLIRILGHQNSPGTPALYGTTDAFLELFGLKSLAELPTLRDLRELNQEPGELDEPEDAASSDDKEQEVSADDAAPQVLS